MHPAAKIQFEHAVSEFSQWRAVPEGERSPAPAWWWQPAFEVAAQHEEMSPLSCDRLELPLASTYAAELKRKSLRPNAHFKGTILLVRLWLEYLEDCTCPAAN
jgi:hypothetical protein